VLAEIRLLPHDDVYAKESLVAIPEWQNWVKATKKKLDEMMEEDAFNLGVQSDRLLGSMWQHDDF
jgi:hypothetical protein